MSKGKLVRNMSPKETKEMLELPEEIHPITEPTDYMISRRDFITIGLLLERIKHIHPKVNHWIIDQKRLDELRQVFNLTSVQTLNEDNPKT